MATRVIPIGGTDPVRFVRVELDGVVYRLRARWNTRAAQWSLDVLDDADVAIVRGVGIVCSWPLLGQYRATPGLPPGTLLALDTAAETDAAVDPGYDDLGTRVLLLYREAA